MANHEDKPLPDLPHSQSFAALTVEGRAHLRRFILHALEEAISTDRELWASGLQQALQDLGDSVLRGGWLAGLRQARNVRTRRRKEENARETQELEERDRMKEEERTKTRQGKHKETPPDDDVEVKRPASEHGSSRLGDPDSRDVKLRQLRELIATHMVPPVPKPSAKHLLLTADAFGSANLMPPDGSASHAAANSAVDCTFTTNVFALADSETDGDVVLYGLEEWDTRLDDKAGESCTQIVGGTFTLSGAASSSQHACLCRVLRLSVYVYLSLLLEQQVLSNSHVPLRFSIPTSKLTPKFKVPLTSSLPVLEGSSASQEQKRGQKRESTVAAGLWSFFSKKTETLLHRAVSVGPSLGRRGSFELPLTRTVQEYDSNSMMDGVGQRLRRISFTSANSTQKARNSDDVSRERPFLTALRQVESSKDLLSTTPGLALPLPSVLASLADREKQDPSRRLTGDEKAALTSILGWEGKEALARGITGMPGFVRQQGLSVLYSVHVPMPLVAPPPSTPTGSGPSPSVMLGPGRFTSCGSRRKWVTYRYYQRDGDADETLGETITRICSTAEDKCDKPGCEFRRADHDMRWIHAGVRVVATVSPLCSSEDKPSEDDAVTMWETCSICGQQSRREQMLDGTYLYSFGKYLELLIYSPVLCTLNPPLCEHTADPPRPWPAEDMPLPRTRFNIYRKFCCRSRTVTFSLSTVDDIFELHIPRLKILRRRGADKSSDKKDTSTLQHQSSQNKTTEDDRRALRREIKNWWQELSEHMDKLEENFVDDTVAIRTKALPRLPSEDDAYDMVDEAALATPKPSMSRLPSSSSSAPTITPTVQEGLTSTGEAATRDSTSSSESAISTPSSFHGQEADSMSLLSGLRHAFQREEQTLYAELSRTPTTSLNDVRRSFLTSARGASKRLMAWETKHSSHLPKGSKKSTMPHVAEPEWWRTGCHAVPGGNVIVREDDWGSIIAFTLSSVDYLHELAAMSSTNPRQPAAPQAPLPTPLDTRQSYFSAGSSFRRLLSGTTTQPDPDEDGIVWQEPETYSAVISRKDHPREPTSLMPFREVLRHKASSEASITATAPKLSTSGSPNAKSTSNIPPSARAKPAVELSMQAADGRLSGAPETADKVLHDLEANASLINSWRSSASSTPSSSSGFVETHIRRGKTASIISTDSDATTGAESTSSSLDWTAPPLPPKDGSEFPTSSAEADSQTAADSPAGSPSFIATSLTNTLASAMRYVLTPGDVHRPLPAAPHHGLLSADSHAIDERPHIKYDWTIGKRLKFSCTVYYAKQFDGLRRRCGIENMFLRSLARSENWAADGGKSRSNFWKTSDDQFIIKTLVNAWNVADLQVLIELGPSYFRYMDATATRPSVLAKLLGFFTVEIRNLESGTTHAKADLLVMENLFYSQKISKTFDLKGIQGRRVKASNSISKTLFDGEWIEDQRRALTLVRPHSKVVFQEAIRADCDYLARSNIMDYSLLLGINDESKHIACGLVDTIGSYTFAKTLEYKAKQGLNAGKEVTVIPPHEYQERFVSAMDDYFLACPDKWSRPFDETRIPHDVEQLPSVL